MDLSPRSPIVRAADFFATGFYSGHLRPAPGTWGTGAGMITYFVANSLFGPFVTTSASLLIAIGVTVFGILVSHIVWKAGLYSATGGDKDDPQQIVIDEFAGYAWTVVGVPVAPLPFILAFFLFRLFDITKPPPARQAENLPGGFGIVIDDVLAGIYARIVLGIILSILG